MLKINERIDLSKATLEIDIESQVFKPMLKAFNKEIKRVTKEVYDKKFEGGEITLKLNIEIPDQVKEIPAVNEFGDLINELYKYKAPNFEHKISTTLKKQYKHEGSYKDRKEVVEEEGHFVVKPLKEAQINVDEYMKEQERKRLETFNKERE